MIKNVVFDLGGVVLDWNPQQVRKEFTGNRDIPEFLFVSGFFQSRWTEFDRGMMTEEELIREMAAASGFSAAECREFMEYVKCSLHDIPGTVELIKDLKARGYKLFCLSNLSVEFYDFLKAREFFQYFDGRIISALEKLVKPDEAIYRLLEDRFGLTLAETLFVDDLEPNVAAARSIGLNAVNFSDREKGYREIDALLQSKGLC